MTRPLGNVKQITITTTEAKVVAVGRGKSVSMLITQVGCTYDIIGYTMSAEVATRRGLTRTKRVLETGLTDATYAKSATGPIEEIGAEVTTFGTSFNADITLASRDSS